MQQWFIRSAKAGDGIRKSRIKTNMQIIRRILLLGFLFIFTVGLMAFIQQKKDELIFSHKKHVGMEFECLTCHDSVEGSESGEDNNLPNMDVCMVCHDGETASEECDACHTNPDDPQTYPRVDNYHKMFAHRTHLERDTECAVCHVGVSEVEIATVANLPRMQVCMQCHQASLALQDCETCHEDYRLLRPESHSNLWVSIHRDQAKIDQTGCADCHGQDYCQSCHQTENLDGLVHDLNYMYNHSQDARVKAVECMSCHETRDFCSDCHRQEMVMPVSHSKIDWSNSLPGDGGRHKSEAGFDLESCAACHEIQEGDPICADCHGSNR